MVKLSEKPHNSPRGHYKQHYLHRITVSVTDKAANSPLADVEIKLTGPMNPPPKKTGVNGQVIFEHLTAGRYTATATDHDYYFLPAEQTNLNSNHLSFIVLQKRQGLDTGGWTLDCQAARNSRKSFVCRYLATDDLGTYGPGLTDQQVQALLGLTYPPVPKPGPPLGIPLLAAEAARYNAQKMDLVAIWEIPEQHRYRPIACLSIDAQHEAGVADGNFASAQMNKIGGAGKPIYFCVDFNVQEDDWTRMTPDVNVKHKKIQLGDLIVAYFQGINEAIGDVNRIGVYGTLTTLRHLFEEEEKGRKALIKYGWQQTFGRHRKDPHHPRAQLLQYDVKPSSSIVSGLGLNGYGGLDLDRAAHPDFGQWQSTRVQESLTPAEVQAERDAIATAYKRQSLLDELSSLSPSQFSDLLSQANIPSPYFSVANATQYVRSVYVIRYFERSTPAGRKTSEPTVYNQLEQLNSILRKVTMESS